MWKGNQRGSSMASAGSVGTPRHGIWPKSAMAMRVKTLAFAAPPWPRIQVRARAMCGASGSSPISFSAQ